MARQAGRLAFKNAAFQVALFHLRSAISYFGVSTWTSGILVIDLTVEYEKMYDAHLLLSQSMLAEGEFQATRLFVEKILRYTIHVPHHRAALLLVNLKAWIGD